MKIINAHLLKSNEVGLIKEVLDFRFTQNICFRDYDGSVELEINPGRKTTPLQKIDIKDIQDALLRAEKEYEKLTARYDELKHQAGKYYKNLQKAPESLLLNLQIPERELGILGERVWSYKDILAKATGGFVELERELLGEFVHLPSPKVILYLGSYRDANERYKELIAVFVHEMFHALDFFVGNGPRTVREMDEPMVEFAAGVFLNAAGKSNPVFSIIDARHRRNVVEKANDIGEIACYGFGRYLMDNVAKSRHGELEWIETYALKSASINPVLKEAQEVIKALNPVYPSGDETRVMGLFEKLIFGMSVYVPVSGSKPRASTTKLKITRRDGTVLQMAKAKDTLILGILEAGILRVYDLKIECFNAYLVDDKVHPKYAHAQYYEEITKLYILHHSNTMQKKQYLEKISNALGLGWKVEIV